MYQEYSILSDLQTDQGIKCLSMEKAGELAGCDPDYGIKDLYEAIATNNFVSEREILVLTFGITKPL